jgi:hypothetical protein
MPIQEDLLKGVAEIDVGIVTDIQRECGSDAHGLHEGILETAGVADLGLRAGAGGGGVPVHRPLPTDAGMEKAADVEDAALDSIGDLVGTDHVLYACARNLSEARIAAAGWT